MDGVKDMLAIQIPDTVTSTPASPDMPTEIPQQSLTKRKSAAISESRLVESRNPNNDKKAPDSTSAKNLKSASGEDDEEDEDKDEEEDMIGKLKAIIVMVELIAFVSITGLLISSLTVKELKNQVIWDLELWKWCVLALVTLSGRLVSQWFINIFVFLIEKNFMLTHLVLYFVYALRTSVSVFIWLTLVLVTWILLFDDGVKRSKETRKVLHYATRTLVSCLVGTVLWLVKTFAVKILAVSFQSKRFFDRIQESIFEQFVLQALSTSRRNEGEHFWIAMRFVFRIEKEKNRKVEIDAEKVRKLTKEKISAWNFKNVISFIRDSKLSIMSNELDEEIIKSESDAEMLAEKIFADLVSDSQSECIGKKQLLPFLKKSRHVKHMLKQFGGAGTSGNISKSDFKNWVVKVYREREFLKCSLNDSKTAIEELNRVFTGFVILLIIILWLLVMGLLTTKIMVIISSQLLLLAFMFGNAAKTLFEAIIFVFVTHPFDVGDRCVIDGVQMIVDEMNILTTIFLRYDNERIYYPNSVLATKPISNFYRSPPEMGDSVEFAIDVFTPVDVIDKLKSRIKDYLERHRMHWSPVHSVVIKDIEDVNKMKMALYVTHTINFQDFGEKVKRRSELVLELKQIFYDLDIKYNLLPQEVRVSYK